MGRQTDFFRAIIGVLLLCAGSAAPAQQQSMATELWREDPALGWIYTEHAPWLWQDHLGWSYFYDSRPDADSWVFSQEWGWLWLSPNRGVAYVYALSTPDYVAMDVIDALFSQDVILFEPWDSYVGRSGEVAVTGITFTGNSIQADIAYTGSDQDKIVLFIEHVLLESNPPQLMGFILRIPAGSDNTPIQRSLSFDLTEIITTMMGSTAASFVLNVSGATDLHVIPVGE